MILTPSSIKAMKFSDFVVTQPLAVLCLSPILYYNSLLNYYIYRLFIYIYKPEI
jgi:hypothetical protein